MKEKEEKLEIFIPNGPRLGNKVIEAKGVAKAYGDKLLFDNLNFMLPPNGIVGVIGPNGAGKTTLFRLIMGLETVDKGTFEVGETVKLAYVDQQHKDIDPEKSVYQVISGGNELIRLGNRDINARAYLSRFNFSGADQEKLIGVLSGGERNRLHLAMALKEEGNVLLLDEPTNGLDITSRQALKRIISRTVDDESTLFISTHQAHDFENLLDHLIILSEGEILLNRSLDEISERLLFARTAYLPEDSLYSEQDLHGYFSILPNEEGEENTPDIELLYKAVLQVPEKIKMIWNE